MGPHGADRLRCAALFSAAVLRIFGLGSEPLDLARNATYVALMSLPGYFLTIAFLDRVGRKRLQLVGFLALGVLYIVLGAAYEPLQQQAWLFMILYGLTFLFSNFGPNATTYIIPGELFPTAIKATCHGISAAAGKVGAAVGGYAFAPLSYAHARLRRARRHARARTLTPCELLAG